MNNNWFNNRKYNNNNNRSNYGANMSQNNGDYGFDSNTNIYPYNFVTLGTECDRASRNIGKLTGYINISVTPKTDIIVPFEKVNEKKYNFFEYNDNYVIPGSQMRGVVRNLYEVLTNSCLSQMEKEYNVSFRYPVKDATKWKPCIVKYTGKEWMILQTSKVLKLINKSLLNSKGIKEQLTKERYYCKELNKHFTFNENKNFINVDNKYILRFGEKKNTKEVAAIKLFEITNLPFTNDENDDVLKIVKNLKKNCQRYVENLNELNTNATADKVDNLYNDIINAIDNEQPFVAYYNEAKKYLSPSNVGREMLKDTLDKMYVGYENCTDQYQLCSACALFGTASDDESVKSRIRFTDLYLDKNGIKKRTMDLVSLGSHLSNYRFYANKEWEENDVRIRGRKFYWHHPVNYKASNIDNANINCSYDTLCFDTNNTKKFEGKIYFESLTEKELKDLVFSIELGGNNHMLKLGHGKPFGYGSILCKCENIYLRKIINNIIVEDKYVDFVRNTWNNYPKLKELELITKFDILKDKWADIKYPNHPRWFANNTELELAKVTYVVNNKKSFVIGKKYENKNNTPRK